jgi:hypothetical protein
VIDSNAANEEYRLGDACARRPASSQHEIDDLLRTRDHADARSRFRVRAALRADALFALPERVRAADSACRRRALRDAARWPWRRSACRVARARRGDCFRWRAPAFSAELALRFVAALELRDAGNFTPARLAFDRPIAMACFAFFAPCLPSRT